MNALVIASYLRNVPPVAVVERVRGIGRKSAATGRLVREIRYGGKIADGHTLIEKLEFDRVRLAGLPRVDRGRRVDRLNEAVSRLLPR
jgi:hypothetical protein